MSVNMFCYSKLLFILYFNVLLFAFPKGCKACVAPPAVQCKHNSVGCTVFNYQGVWDDYVPCRASYAFSPTTETQLIDAVAHAVRNKLRINIHSSFTHSFSKLVCVGEGGVAISTRKYGSVINVNKTAMTITVEGGAMMRDVIDAAANEGLALTEMPYWEGISAAGAVSTGAHGSGLVGKGSGMYERVVGMRLVVPATPSEGYAKVITLTEADAELNAARISLGLLGAISQITFALEPMFKRSVTYSLKADNDLEIKAENFLRKYEFGHIWWFPSHGKGMFGAIERVSVDTPGNGLNIFSGFQPMRVVDVEKNAANTDRIQATEDANTLCNNSGNSITSRVASGGGFFNDGKNFTGYPVIGFNNKMQTSGGCQNLHHHKHESNSTCSPTKIADKNQTICSWDRRVHRNLNFDVEVRLPLSRIRDAIVDVKKLRDLNPSAMCELDMQGVLIRTITKSAVYLGPAEDEAGFELLYYSPPDASAPTWNMDVYQEIEQIMVEKYGGTLHWGVSGGFLFEGLTRRAVNANKFLSVKKRFDPDGVFSNDWTDGLFGIGGKSVEKLGEGCALHHVCKCREDKHCAPEKGYLCKPGRIWKKARVCRKVEN